MMASLSPDFLLASSSLLEYEAVSKNFNGSVELKEVSNSLNYPSSVNCSIRS